MHFQAIVFDMDGLLVNSEVVWNDAETELIEARGYQYTEEARAQIVGLRVDEFMAKLHAHYALTESVDVLVRELNDRMLQLIPVKVSPMAGAAEILRYVVEHNIPRAIASNSSRAIIDATLAAQGWEDIFTIRCTADDEKLGKPAPDVYLRAAERLGVDPKACLGIEDSVNGARGVVAAGMTCFAVPDLSHTNKARFADITPHVFNDLHEVLAHLQA
ncbi:MAG: HAD family phosphatase [Anaerolineae bacterium]|jgi:HAD superfamily hydrolase (TIGR01509 family)|nr:HAD family phosphatase [Anaerolineae bacterium]